MAEQAFDDLLDRDGFVYIKDTLEAPGNFLIAHILGRSLKEGRGVVLAALDGSPGHYERVMRKLGVQLSSFSESGQLTMLDWLSSGGCEATPACHRTLQQLHGELTERMASMVEAGRFQKYSLIIDCVTTLRSVCKDHENWLGFLQYCRTLGVSTRVPITLVALAHEDVPDDDPWLRWAEHVCTVSIRIHPLDKLTIAQVDGALTATSRMDFPKCSEFSDAAVDSAAEPTSCRLFYRVKETKIQFMSSVEAKY